MEKLNFNLKKSVLERDFPFKKNKTLSFVLFLLILSCFHNNANGQSYTRTQSWPSGGNGTWATFDWGSSCKNLNTIVPAHALNISVQITMTGGDFDLYTYNSASCPTQLLWTSRPYLSGTNTETVSGFLNYCNSLNTTIAVRKAFAGAGAVTITVSWTVPSYNINSTSSLNETFNTNSSSIANWLYQSNVAGTSASPSVVASGANVTTSPQEGNRMVFYNSYGITAGGQSRLISPTLNTSGTGTNGIDVEFYWRNDNGYATSDDRVQVQYSTDNGCTWVNAGPTFSRYNASGGTGTWNFQSVSIGSAAVGSTVRIAFLFTSQYGNNCFLDNVTVKQRCFNGNVATFGSNVWNAYCYSSGDNAGGDNAWNSSTVRGMYTMSTLNFDTRSGQTNSNAQSWGDGSTPSNASGYSGCAIDVDFHSYIFKRQGFTCGTYQLNLPSHDDMAILLVDGIEVWRNYGCCATRTAVWTGYLGATSTVELRVSEGGGGSHGALEFVSLSTTATLTGTNPTTCGGNGSIAISNQQNGHNITYRSDFSSAPAGSSLTGNAAITGGELRLTSAANSQLGSAVLQPATRANAWTANYSQFIGSGNGADGMSFSYGQISGAANGNSGAGGESGWTSGLVVSFDTHNGATNSQLNIYWNGSIIWSSALNVQNFRTSNYLPVKILVNTSNQLSVTWNSIDLLTNYALPADYGSANKSTWNYGFSARTGGLNDAHKVSDVYISSIANLEYSINGTTWSATNPIVAAAGTYTVQARPAVGVDCPVTLGTVTLTNPNTIDWANLQFPSSASICSTGSATVYGRVYKNGYTSVAGADANMTVQVGINSTNTNPNTWAAGAWSNASFNVQSGNDDEYQATLSGLASGTYYYTMRYKYCTDGAWYYGGYNVGGGGFYNGTTNVNGVLTVNALPTVTTANTAAICSGTSTNIALTASLTSTYTWTVGTITGSITGASSSSGATIAQTLTNPSSSVSGSLQYIVTPTSTTGSCSGTPYTITVTVNPILSAALSISATATTVCSGTSVTFTATPTNGGTTPSYQWKLNGTNVGSNAATFTTTTLANNDVVTCVMTSNASPCLTGSPATSNGITMVVNPILPASISIAASETTVCAGTSVTFTATPTNGGASPAYQWKVNGTNIGTNSAIFTTTTLANNDVVTCVLTSNAAPCLSGSPATSNGVSMIVNPILPASVSIVATSSTICDGTSVTFTATPTNGGTTPAYQWKLNGTNVGSNSSTYSTTVLANNDVVNCVLTSNATPCLTGSPATSNGITMVVNPILPASVSIAASATTICSGTSVTFTATPTNGGTSPVYQWKLNGTNVGTNAATFTSTTFANNDIVTCLLTSNATPCLTGSPATSNSETLSVNALPSVNAGSDQTSCTGASVTLTGSGATAYTWNNGVTNGVAFTPSSTTTYTVTGTDANGCQNTDQVLVTITALSSTAATNGDYFWKGTTNTDWSNASNWLTYNGTTYSVASVPPTSSNKVIIPVPSTGCVVTQPATITNLSGDAKDIVIESGASLGLSSATLNVTGNWTNNGIFTPGTGTVAFVGTSGNQTITKTGGETFAYMTVNKSSGNVVLNNNVTVVGGLTLTNGKVELGTNNLTMGGATLTGGSSSSYVKTGSTGVLKRNLGNTGSVFFPVGNSAYNPAELTNTIDSDVFSLRVVDAVYINGTSGNLQSTSVVNRTWMIGEETQGGNSVKMKLYWNGGGEEATSFTANQAFVAHYVSSSSMWDNMGGGAGLGYVESTQATTSFSPFTISSSPTFAPLPVELMSLDAQCAGENVIVSWKTASEHNSLNYVVERSENGTAWNEVQTLEAAGNSNTVLEYAIEDAGAARGVKYYRLIQTDQDGVQKIYGPILSNCGSDGNIFFSFPNPSDAEITIVFNDKNIIGSTALNVRDAHGRVVRSIALEIQPGTTSILIPDMELEPAVYYLQLVGDNFTSPVLKHSLR